MTSYVMQNDFGGYLLMIPVKNQGKGKYKNINTYLNLMEALTFLYYNFYRSAEKYTQT